MCQADMFGLTSRLLNAFTDFCEQKIGIAAFARAAIKDQDVHRIVVEIELTL